MSKEEIMDKLWPEDSPDKAVRMLYNGIYYIRKAIEAYGIDREMLSIGSDYNIKLKDVEVDADRFYEFEKSSGGESIEELEKIAALYSDDYMRGEDYSWADYERQRLSELYVQCLIRLSSKLSEARQWDRAEQYLISAYNRDPYEERITELLLELYKNTGNKNRAIRHFNAYSQLIHEELGVKPGKRVMELIKF
jgi:two-component SAPR family response regulator